LRVLLLHDKETPSLHMPTVRRNDQQALGVVRAEGCLQHLTRGKHSSCGPWLL